jgi:DNA polymerase I-like protein with 3'-5' exonuclease and polymerase domains
MTVRNVRGAGRRHAIRRAAARQSDHFGIIYGISAFGLANQLGIELRSGSAVHIKTIFHSASPRHPGPHMAEQLRSRRPMKPSATRCSATEVSFPNARSCPEASAALSERLDQRAPIQGLRPPTSSAAP